LTASVASFLSKAQRKGTELPPAVSGALLLAAVRLSDAKGQALRPYQLLVDDGGGIDLLTGEPPTGDGYAAPELRNGAVLHDDPRVLVYAAGALGYELVTLTPPQAGLGVGLEVHGPLAKVIRKAMAERQKRFKNLTEMARAIEAIHGRPTRVEEQLILAAVAASTPLPPAQKLAKMELEKAATPEATAPSQGDDARLATQPVFTQIWDPLDGSPEPEIAPPAAAEARPREQQGHEPLRTELQAERQARAELSATVESRGEHLSQLGTRLSLLEEQVRTSLPPPLSPAAALLREVNQLLERRRFAEAERALRDPVVQNDALLQLRLGQALSSMSDSGTSGLARAEAAFRRASELDAGWAQPRAHLGMVMSRQGRRKEAGAQFRAALKLDPVCPEALAALAGPGRGAAGLALSGTGGALAAALLVLAFRLPPKPAAPQPVPRIEVASPGPAPAAIQPSAPTPVAVPAPARPAAPAREPEPHHSPLPLPERKPGPAAETEPSQAARAPRPEPKPRARKVASSARAAAEEEAAKGDKALRAFDTNAAQAAFASALKLDPTLAAAHRGMGMVYVLLGKNAEAKAEYARYLDLAPDAPDKDQIARLVSR